ncbi:MAG: DUF4286 family protein [Bacteroidota bacterium]
MIIYSVTVTIDATIEADWKSWMQRVHIPDVMATGFFQMAHLQKLLEPAPDAGLATYNLQYECPDLATYVRYQEEAAPALQADHTARYKDRFVAFRTILERETSY